MSYINISSNTTWTAEGPAWVTNMPMDGAGNFSLTPICDPNDTLDLRSGNIVITYADETSTTIPIVQYAEDYVDAKIYILGLDGDVGQLVRFGITTPLESMDSVNTGCGETMDISNNPQIGIIPVTGDEVTVYVSAKGYTSVEKPFVPSFNNKVYWHTSSDPLLSGEDVINDGATEITMAFNPGDSPRYQGSFTYSRNTYYYIVIDMRNIITCSGGYKGITGIGSYYPVNVEMNFTSGGARGISGINIATSDTNNIITGVYNNSQVAYVSSGGTGNFTFMKTSADDDTLYLSVTNEGPIEGNVKFSGVCAFLNSVEISSTGYESSSAACDARFFTTIYFNGNDDYPVVGDYIFTDSSGVASLNGDNKYYSVPDNGTTIKIDSNGGVVSVTSCFCEEAFAPDVTPATFYIQLGAVSSFKIEATHNPTSWIISSTVHMVTFNGNETGGVFDYVDENGCFKTLSVGIGEAIITPVQDESISMVSSSATYTIGGTYIPYGLSIDDNGILQTNFSTSGTYSIQVAATNCAGVSPFTLISFTVQHPPTLSPFQMTSVGECDSASACSSTECMSTFWFDGVNCEGTCSYPAVNDFVYIDGYKNDILNGGYLYYKMDNSNWILIDGIGQVINTGACGG
jgi:hypothetical protein